MFVCNIHPVVTYTLNICNHHCLPILFVIVGVTKLPNADWEESDTVHIVWPVYWSQASIIIIICFSSAFRILASGQSTIAHLLSTSPLQIKKAKHGAVCHFTDADARVLHRCLLNTHALSRDRDLYQQQQSATSFIYLCSSVELAWGSRQVSTRMWLQLLGWQSLQVGIHVFQLKGESPVAVLTCRTSKMELSCPGRRHDGHLRRVYMMHIMI